MGILAFLTFMISQMKMGNGKRMVEQRLGIILRYRNGKYFMGLVEEQKMFISELAMLMSFGFKQKL